MREGRATSYGSSNTHPGLLWTLLAALGATVLVAWAAAPAQAEDEVREPQVVGGQAVPDGRYPFMASIQFNKAGTSAYKDHFCGGTLVSARHVLTAGHCAAYIRKNIPLRKLRVVVGTTVLTSGQGQARGVSKVKIHPRFNRKTYSNDAAVLRLNRPVSGIRPISLSPPGADGYERPSGLATVAGWGNKIQQGPGYGQRDNFPSRMREARPPLVSDNECRRKINADFGGGFFDAGVEVCAGRTGVDTCQGDSGGPMFVRTATGRYVQIGITSYGNGCGARGNPGVYAEVNSGSIRNFILGAIGGA